VDARIALNIAPHPGIRVLPIQFPASQTYLIKPLNEHVPVYQKPFTLVQKSILEGTKQAQAAPRGRENVTLTGTLAMLRPCFRASVLDTDFEIADP
jgi:hypothetical protein